MAIFSGIAAAIGTAFNAVSTFIGGLGTIGSFVLKTAVGLGTSLLGQSLAGKPAEQKFSVTTELQAGGDLPRSIIFGYTATAGSLQYANTWGRLGETDNAFLTQVIQLADYPVQDLVELWVNGELCTIGETPHPEYGYPVTEYFKGGHDNLWIRFYDGTQTAADPFLVSRVSSATRPYSDKRVGRGIPYVVVTSLVTKNLFSGVPSFRFGLHGAKLYDPSRDSTVGGVGSHRRGDPSTWGGDGDFLPAVQLYALQSGISYGGEWLYGLQNMAAAQLPVAHWIGKIAKCRAEIDSADGAVPTYRSGGEIEVNVALGDAIDAFLTACQGRVSEIGGVYKLHLGAPDAPVMSFTDEDILSTEEQSFTPFFGLADTINGISARYPSPADGWNTKVAPPLYRADLEALAGNRRLMADVSLDFVPYAEQVQRLMKSALEEAQRARRHTFVLPPQFWPLEPGDTIAWTSERNGYEAKLFRVDGVVDRGNLDIMVDLTEVDPADYDWDSGADFKPPVSGSLGPVRPTPQVIVDWFAEPWQIEDASGTGRRPAIRLSWDGDQPDVDAVAFEVALAETLEVIYRGRTDEPEAGAIVISQGLLPIEDYLVRGRYVPRSDRETEFSGWLPVTTLDIRLTDQDVFLPGVLEDLQDFVEEALDWISNPESPLIPLVEDIQGNATAIVQEATDRQDAIQAEAGERIADAANLAERFRRLDSSQQNIALVVSELSFQAYEQRETIRREIKVESDALTARYTEAITAAIDGEEGIVNRVEILEVSSASLAAAISSEQTARISAVEALALDISLISVGTNQQFDWQTIWNFDTTIEGWTGNGTPTWLSGFLRPANQASDPYVTSPRGIGALGTQYRQLRFGIRKVGNPTWEGFAWWRAESVETWSTAQRVSFSEPTYDGSNFAVVIINPEWTGTVDQIRLDLSTAADASNYFLIDWVAIGRPSPGASQAALLAEQLARTTADSALAESISILSASLNDLEGEVAGQATLVNEAVATVEDLDGIVTTLTSQVATLNSVVPGKADATVVDSLAAEVAALGGGGFVSSAQAIRSLRSQLDNVALLVAEQDFANKVDSQNALKAVADAYSLIETYARQIDDRVEVQARRVDGVTVTLGLKADASVVTSQEARISVIGDQVTALSTAVTAVQSTIPTLASASAVSALATAVSEQEGIVTSQAEAISDLNAALGGSSAGIRIRATASATPGGYAARYGIQARTSTTDGFRSASLFLDVPADTGSPTRVVAVAEQFVITNGSQNARPFVFEGGVAYLDEIRARAGFIEQFVSETAFIENLTVGTSNINFQAITGISSAGTGAGSRTTATAFLTVATLNIGEKIAGAFVQVDGQLTANSGNNQTSLRCRVFRTDTNTAVYTSAFATAVSGGSGNVSVPLNISGEFRMNAQVSPSNSAQYLIQIEVPVVGFSGSAGWNLQIQVIYWKA